MFFNIFEISFDICDLDGGICDAVFVFEIGRRTLDRIASGDVYLWVGNH